MFDPADAPDPDDVYGNYLKTCAMLGIDPVPRARALGLIQEWTEALSGRPEPTTQALARIYVKAALRGGFRLSAFAL